MFALDFRLNLFVARWFRDAALTMVSPKKITLKLYLNTNTKKQIKKISIVFTCRALARTKPRKQKNAKLRKPRQLIFISAAQSMSWLCRVKIDLFAQHSIRSIIDFNCSLFPCFL